MTTIRIELDFRAGVTEPLLEPVAGGARLILTREQEQVVLLLPHDALGALWLAVTAGVVGPASC